MKVYVDDMLVKSRSSKNHIIDLDKIFNILRKYKIKLNPTKYTFRVTSEKLLGFLVSRRGIEANPKKIQTIQEMAVPKIIKEVQYLTEKIAALNHFVSRSVEYCMPFFHVLK